MHRRPDARDKRHQGGDVGRARFEPHQLAAVGRAAVGVGENPVEAQSGPLQILLGRGVDDLYVGGLEPPEVFGGDTGQRFAAFERHHAPETAAQEKRIDAQSAGEVQRRVAVDPFVRRTRLARRLLEGQRREYALRGGIRRQFRCRPREVFDLRGDQPRVGHGAVEGHVQRIAAAGDGNGPLHFVRKQQFVFFGGHHAGKCTLFFGSADHAATVASVKKR